MQAAQDRRDEDVRHHARIFQMDMVTIALGRMGFRESRFKEFNRILDEVAIEYSKDILADAETDKELWYTKDSLDREIRQYVGSMFVPYEERYK